LNGALLEVEEPKSSLLLSTLLPLLSPAASIVPCVCAQQNHHKSEPRKGSRSRKNNSVALDGFYLTQSINLSFQEPLHAIAALGRSRQITLVAEH